MGPCIRQTTKVRRHQVFTWMACNCMIDLELPFGPHIFIKDCWKENMKSTIFLLAQRSTGNASSHNGKNWPDFLSTKVLIWPWNGSYKHEIKYMIKMNLSLSKYALSAPLLNALRIESIKHHFCFLSK